MRARHPSILRLFVAVVTGLGALSVGVAVNAPGAAAQETIPLTQCWNWANNEYRAWQGALPGSDAPEAGDDVIDPESRDHVRDADEWGYTTVPDALLDNDQTYLNTELPDHLRWRLYANPQHADSFELFEDGSFHYSPKPGYYGGDSFQYVWTATGYCSNVATVTILPFKEPRYHDDSYRVDPIPALPVGETYDTSTPPAAGPSFVTDSLCATVEVQGAVPVQFTVDQVRRLNCGFLYNDEHLGKDDVPYASGVQVGDAYRTFKGWVWFYGDGRFGYRPDPGATGLDSFAYGVERNGIRIGWGDLGDEYGRVTFRLELPPTVYARDDGPFEVAEDGSLPIDLSALLSNDTAVSGIATVQRIDSSFGRPATVRTRHGTLAIGWFSQLNSGVWSVTSLTYTPDPNFTGTDDFLYNARGATSGFSLATVKLQVTATDDPPQANPDGFQTWSGAIQPLDVLANDVDPDGDLDPSTLRVLQGGDPFTVQGQMLVYDVPDGFYGARIAQYDVADERGVRDDAFLSVRISPLVPDAYQIGEDQPLTVTGAGVRANDAAPLAGTATVQVVSEPTHGTLALSPDGAFAYTPDLDFAGTDTFTYRAVSADPIYALEGETATVTITVIPVNDAPAVAYNTACAFGPGLPCASNVDVRSVFEGGEVRLRGSITDPDPDFRGTLMVAWGDGSTEQFAYPCDPASFGATACAGRLTLDPTWIGPVKRADRVYFDLRHRYLDEKTPLGPYTISLLAMDETGTATPSSTNVGVEGVAPTVTTGPDCLDAGDCPAVIYQEVTGTIQPVSLMTRVTDPGDDDVTVTIDWGDGSTDDQFVADCTAGAVCARTYLHAASCPISIPQAACGYDLARTHLYAAGGVYTITVTAIDDEGKTTTSTTTATLEVPNATPSAAADDYTIDEDGTLAPDPARNVLGNDSDPDGDELTASVTIEPTKGTLDLDADGTFSYTPDADVHGQDGFTYEACDTAGACATASVTLTITPVNDAPTAGDDETTTAEDDSVAIAVAALLANDDDVDGDQLLLGTLGQPAHGTVALTGGGSTLTYTPDPDANGADAFDYDVCDPSGACASGTVDVAVAPVNDAPVAGDDQYATDEDTALTIPAATGLLANDGDIDGDAIVVTGFTDPDHGTVTINPSGTFLYVPEADWFGEASFTYRIRDTSGTFSALATVRVTVRSANDLPAIAVRGGSCLGDSVANGRIDLRVGDLETAAGSLSLSAVSSSTSLIPAKGLTLAGTGADRSLTISAAAKKTGTATVTVRVTDANGGKATVTIAVTVGGAKNDTVTGGSGADLMFGLNGSNTLVGGPAGDTSIDILCGGSGTDTLRGMAGNDVLDGGSGADTLDGGDGDDLLLGGGGADVLLGGAGVDRLTGGSGGDRFDGGPATDVYTDFKASEGDVQVSPA